MGRISKNNNNRQYQSRTRASIHAIKKGDMAGSMMYRGWRPANGGISYAAFPTGEDDVESKTMKGVFYEKFLVKIKPQYGPEYLATGFRTVDGKGSDRVRIPSENVVISPNGGNSGYCGPYIRKDYDNG